jgi:hypothetical protein
MPTALFLAAALSAAIPQGGVLPEEKAAYDILLATQVRAANDQFSGSPCADAKVEVVSVEPWRIVNNPTVIVWRERVRVTGCGHSAIENVNAGRVGGSPPWRMTTGLPGTSLADMTLQGATLPAAVTQAKAGLAADCQSISLKDVYVAARPGGVDFALPGSPAAQPRKGHPGITLPDTAKPMLDKIDLSAAWMEVWPLTICGHDRTLGVVFIPLKDRSAIAPLFLPIWQQIEAHGPGAIPAPVSPDN